MAPEIVALKVSRGVAGAVAVAVTVRYPGEAPMYASFAGSHFGAPVAYTFVSRAPGDALVSGIVAGSERFGDFGSDPEGWVRRFYA